MLGGGVRPTCGGQMATGLSALPEAMMTAISIGRSLPTFVPSGPARETNVCCALGKPLKLNKEIGLWKY